MYSRYGAIFTSIALITIWLISLAQPIPAMAQQPSTASPLGLIECEDGGLSRDPAGRFNLEPMDSTDMNTVIVGSDVKTIHIEKEIIDCFSLDLLADIIIDLSIYTKLIEPISSTQNITTIPNITFEVVACYKLSNGSAILGCEAYTPSTALPPTNFITDCFRPLNVAFPIEMNTVVNSSNFVKTVVAEKEVFACGNVLDITIFTEIFEDVEQGTSTKIIFSTKCAKQIEVPKVLGCEASLIEQL